MLYDTWIRLNSWVRDLLRAWAWDFSRPGRDDSTGVGDLTSSGGFWDSAGSRSSGFIDSSGSEGFWDFASSSLGFILSNIFRGLGCLYLFSKDIHSLR